jgi:transglutaminase-like putative cysteine protease
LILLIAALAAIHAAAADLEVGSFQASSANTSNGSIVVRGDPDASTRVIWLVILKKDRSGYVNSNHHYYYDEYFLSPEQARAGRKVYLHQGSGDYSIEVFGSPVADGRTAFQSIDDLNAHDSDTKKDMYLLPSGRVNSDAPEIIALARKITEGLPDAYAKTRAIHDWVASSISYDAQVSKELLWLARQPDQGAFQRFVNVLNIQNRETALAVWKDRKGLCEGYVNLTAALSRAVGISNKIIYGNIPEVGPDWNHPRPGTFEATGEHAWNAAWVGDRWVLEDTTLDSGGVNPDTRYFDPRANVFAQDHYAISERF